MSHFLSLLITIIVFLPQSSQITTREVDLFIQNYKSAYENYLKKSRLNASLTYVPSIMNLYEKNNYTWFNLSIIERQQNFFSYIHHPILAVDFAIDVNNEKYFCFPEGWLYHNLPRYRVNHMVASSVFPSEEKVLLKYLKRNHTDYVFTVTNLGNGSIDCRYWVISDNHLYVLRYDKILDELYPVEIIDYLTKNLLFFKYSWE